MWDVEYTDEFERWWDKQGELVQVDVAACVGLLEELGPSLEVPLY